MGAFSKTTFVLAVILLAGAANVFAEAGVAELRPTSESGTATGTVHFEDTPDGLRVTADLSSVPAGKHGFHIHQFGACGDAGNAAGGHYNPDGHSHGLLQRDGLSAAHAGDLGNIDVAADGNGRLEAVIAGLTLSGGRYAVAGRSVILHEKEDDFGQPTGNAGVRIACGEITIKS